MKPCSSTRNEKSTCANIFLELPLTILFRNHVGMNTTLCYWSYIEFYTLITYNYMLTNTYNSDTAAGAEFISSPQRCSLTFCKFHRKASVLESLFCNVASLQVCNITKKTPTQVFSCEIWEILNNTYFEKHLNDCFCVLITS